MKTLFLLVTVLLFGISISAQEEGYTIPDAPEGMNPDEVVAQVGDETITLEELRTRIRYERFYYYHVLEEFIETQGAEAINLEDPNNPYAPSVRQLLATLVNDKEFVEPIYRTMILESLYRQEAQARSLLADECTVNEFWALMLNIQDQFMNCQLPDGFDEVQAQYLNHAETYTGMTAETISEMLTARAEYDVVSAAIAEEYEVPDIQVARSRHILVEDAATANEVLERLQAGEDFQALLQEYTVDMGAEGNAGELGTIERGASGLGTAFEEAAFSAEVGQIIGPIETERGFEVLEVLDQEFAPRVRARHILFDNEEDANTALDLINSGADFAELAAEYSLDPGSGRAGGDLGFFEQAQMVAPFAEAAFNAEIGQLVGPVQTDFGYHIIEVTEREEQISAVNVRHILVETEEVAQDVIERLNAGEDFNAVAQEVSLDYTARGHGGDTGLLTAGLSEPGFYAEGETLSQISDAVFDAEAGDLLGPIETSRGFYIVEVQEFSTRPPTPQEAEIQKRAYAQEWQAEQLASDRIERSELWTWDEYIPYDPVPSDVSEQLSSLDAALAQAADAMAALEAETIIPNILRELQVPAAVGE